MKDNSIQGAIWFHKEFHGGLMEDFEIYAALHQESKLIMSLYTSSQKELSQIAQTLNNSNLRSLGN